MENKWLHQYGLTQEADVFYLSKLKKYLDGRSVFHPDIFRFDDVREVVQYVNQEDCFARLVMDTTDVHLFAVLFDWRKHIIDKDWVIDSQRFLSKMIDLEGPSDLDAMPNLKSSLIRYYQMSLGTSLVVPGELHRLTLKISFEVDEFGNLRPYWPNKMIRPEFRSMLAALYPLPLKRLDESPEAYKGIPYFLVEVANAPVQERENLIADRRGRTLSIEDQMWENSIAALQDREEW